MGWSICATRLYDKMGNRVEKTKYKLIYGDFAAN